MSNILHAQGFISTTAVAVFIFLTGYSQKASSASIARDTIDLDQILVTATRVDQKEPLVFHELDRETIEANNYGQDPSAFLQKLSPSVLAYSDAGADIGNYVQFRMRGMDQTRINTSLNGVPLNDMIDQGVFFSNFSDFMSSVGSIQILRGVGTTNGGLSTYAGSVAFSSPKLFSSSASGSAELGFGSFDTKRFSAQVTTGLTPHQTAFYGRMSRTLSNGYKTHSASDAYSLFVSGGYLGDRDAVRITAFAGKTQNDQAYLPVLLGDIESDPKTNYNHPNDTDDFEQEMVQIQHSRYFSNSLKTSTTLYYGGARGVFPFSLDNTTQLLFGLNNNHYGLISEWKIEQTRWSMRTGFHAYTFRRKNESFTSPNTFKADYDDRTVKSELSYYLKLNRSWSRWSLQADIQIRHVGLNFETGQVLSYGGPVPTGFFKAGRNWTFFNPKAGITFQPGPENMFFASVGSASREPTRTDILQGDGSAITDLNLTSVTDEDVVRAERVLDLELGWRRNTASWNLQTNLFIMQFDDEITQVGALAQRSYVPLRQNVSESYRSGIELISTWNIKSNWRMDLNALWMKTGVDSFSSPNGDVNEVQHIFAPEWIINPSVQWTNDKSATIELSLRSVASSFMELSNNTEFVLPAYAVVNVSWKQVLRNKIEVFVALNNVMNVRYFNDGTPVDLDFDGLTDGPGYRIQAPRNLYLGLKYRW